MYEDRRDMAGGGSDGCGHISGGQFSASGDAAAHGGRVFSVCVYQSGSVGAKPQIGRAAAPGLCGRLLASSQLCPLGGGQCGVSAGASVWWTFLCEPGAFPRGSDLDGSSGGDRLLERHPPRLLHLRAAGHQMAGAGGGLRLDSVFKPVHAL